MIAAGIDVGGTKIESQIFADDWSILDTRRVATPKDYAGLVAILADQIGWTQSQSGAQRPIGISAAGLINPATGLALTANLAASGKPFWADVVARAGRPVTFVNDCRALILSEAVFGVGRGVARVAGLILGTGVGGGLTIDGKPSIGPTSVGGEWGHTSAPVDLVVQHRLPVVVCGCGRKGCIETLISGPGLTRIAKAMTGQDINPEAIAAARSTDPVMARIWNVWCDLVADLMMTLALTVDPDLIILGGGVTQTEGVVADLKAALTRAQWPDFAIPELALAQGGSASGARGAAYAAYLDDRQKAIDHG